ncbi:DUF4333 domain-containing protein [Streptomyces sp. A30]|uniref:DUF4333 domain-containing protein n=1 Tax=Streptomyces sp. A30 TaxID=2789273 RepID=UPI003980FF67
MAEARGRVRGRGWSHFLSRRSRSLRPSHQSPQEYVMQRKFLVGAVGGAAAVAAVFGVGTHLLSGTQSTTGLNDDSGVSVGGHRALAAGIVAGRTESKYHPLPWVGAKVSGVTCPTGLKAVAGATVTCTGKKSDGETVDIPVTVVKATTHSVTWKFER